MNIISIKNPKVKYWEKLKLKKYRDEEGVFLIEGDHLVDEALKRNLVLELIVLNGNYNFKNKYLVTKEIMKKISNQVTTPTVAAVVKKLDEKDIEGNIIILDNLQDPGNLGTIIRSAAAFNFKNIILGDGTVDLYNDKVIRATEGLLFEMNFLKRNIIDYLSILKNDNYLLVGTDVSIGDNIKDYTNEKLALIIGNEGKGIDKNIKCDKYVKLNMENTCESLNAGVAASILMYEVYSGR